MNGYSKLKVRNAAIVWIYVSTLVEHRNKRFDVVFNLMRLPGSFQEEVLQYKKVEPRFEQQTITVNNFVLKAVWYQRSNKTSVASVVSALCTSDHKFYQELHPGFVRTLGNTCVALKIFGT